jgi:aminopeptidase
LPYQRVSFEEDFARALIQDSLRISERDVVTIGVAPHTIALGEAIAVECFKVGADAMLNLFTDRYQEGYLSNLSIESLREPSKFCVKLTEAETAIIWAYAPWDPAMYRRISQERLAASAEAEYKAHWPLARERKVRTVFVGTALVTPPRARVYGLNFPAWKRNMNLASLADPKKLAGDGRRLAGILEKAGKVSLRAPNGTELTLQLTGRKASVDDGVIDEEDIASDNLNTSIPAGSVRVAPDEDSADGVVRFDLPLRTQGRNVRGVRLEFEGGRVIALDGGSNLHILKKEYEASSGDKDKVASLRIGINPDARYGFLHDGIVAGSIGIGIGFNEALGGENKSPFFLEGIISRGTLELDGKSLVVNGRLKLH